MLKLNKREKQIIRLVGEGKKNSEIGESVGFRESTVKVYLNRIFTKCGVNSRLQLALWSQTNGERLK